MNWSINQNSRIIRTLAWFGVVAIFILSVVPAEERPVTGVGCGGIELLQIPLPTRHARVSDFAVDLLGACFAIGLVAFWPKLGAFRRSERRRG
jgi:VanZ family protein